MKNRKGYISIVALIVMAVSMILILKMIFLNNQQSHITNSRENNIQSYYLSEGKILMSLYVEKYYDAQLYPMVLDIFRKSNYATEMNHVTIDKSDLGDYDNKAYVNLSVNDSKNRKELVLKSQSNYKGNNTSTKARATLVNELFEIKESILSMDTIEEEYKRDLEKLLTNIEKNISTENINNFNTLHTKEIFEFNKISLKKVDETNCNILCKRDTMLKSNIEGFDKREVFILIKAFEDNKSTLHIDCSDRPITLGGIIYIEGDMEISGEFTFNGIIIVKGGKIKINSEIKPIVNGMMILYDNENIIEVNKNMDLQYYGFTVYKYGNLLPGFFDIKLKSIKNGE